MARSVLVAVVLAAAMCLLGCQTSRGPSRQRVVGKAKGKPVPFPNWTAERWRVKVMTPGGEAWKEITYYKNPLGMEFVRVPAGEFQMGSEKGSADEKPVHRVRIAKAFYMQAHEVTNGQYRMFRSGHNSKEYKGATLNGDRQPVGDVSWKDAVAFCEWLTRRDGAAGARYRLPTEAEWEYACRAGSRTQYYFGDRDADLHKCGNYADKNASILWADKAHNDGHAVTAPVGSYLPNAFGLYDMSGNVWEWCQSLKKAYPYSPSDGREDLSAGGSRVLRSGSWFFTAVNCRSADRLDGDPSCTDSLNGFRVAVSSPPQE